MYYSEIICYFNLSDLQNFIVFTMISPLDDFPPHLRVALCPLCTTTSLGSVMFKERAIEGKFLAPYKPATDTKL